LDTLRAHAQGVIVPPRDFYRRIQDPRSADDRQVSAAMEAHEPVDVTVSEREVAPPRISPRIETTSQSLVHAMAGVNRLCEEATALCQVLWCSYSHAYILLHTTCSCQWVPYPNVWGRPEILVATGFARIGSFSRLIPDNRVRRSKHRQIQGLGALKPNARQQRRTESKEGAPGSEPLLSGQPSAMEIQAREGGSASVRRERCDFGGSRWSVDFGVASSQPNQPTVTRLALISDW
jgi:hypothetical protein